MSPNETAVLLAVLTLIVSTAALPGVVVADETLDVSIAQQPETGEALVSVTQDGRAVGGANVSVTADGAYAGNGTYRTDANGTVTLPNPDEAVDATVTVSDGDAERTVETRLVPREDSLAVAVEGGVDENATVTVTQYDEPVEGATVDASGDGYAGDGAYRTDADGEVELPAPAGPTDVTLNATADDLRAERTVTLGLHELELDVEDEDDGVTVAVERNDTGVAGANVSVEAAEGESYAGEGEYATDDNGTVGLPTPDGTVNVTVAATADGDAASENVTLENETRATRNATFGNRVSSFVHRLLSGASGGVGAQVSAFARENNPGQADDRANGAGNATETAGERGEKPEKGAKSDRGRETPETPETPERSEKPDRNDADDDEESDDERNDGGGPPAHANN